MPLDKIKKEEFWAIYRGLPKDLQTTLFAEETADKMMAIKEKFALKENYFSELVRLVSRILLGKVNLPEFIKLVIEATSSDTQKATAIAQDINMAIFQPVRESLMRVHGLERGLTRNNTR